MCGRRAGWEQRSPNFIQTHGVEPGGTRGQILHLTWGDLSHESGREVSRGRSSEEAGQCRWSEGPKKCSRKARRRRTRGYRLADPPTESHVREPDGRSGLTRKFLQSAEGGGYQRRRPGDGRNEGRRPGEAPGSPLGKDP